MGVELLGHPGQRPLGEPRCENLAKAAPGHEPGTLVGKVQVQLHGQFFHSPDGPRGGLEPLPLVGRDGHHHHPSVICRDEVPAEGAV